MNDWTLDPLERARYLDGEGSSEERAARAADLLRDPAARARVDADARFLAVVATGAAAAPRPSDLLAARVRAALAADRAAGFPSTGAGDATRTRRKRLAVAATFAALALGAVVWSSTDRVTPTTASDDEARRLAAEAYLDAVVGVVPADGAPGGSCDEGPASPHRFPLVMTGEVAVEGCREQGPAAIAVMRRTGDARMEKGLVVLPADGRSAATDVGYTRVDDVIVFDVTIGRAKYFLATAYPAVDGTPMCAACHGPARAAAPERNPHRFVERPALLLRRGK